MFTFTFTFVYFLHIFISTADSTEIGVQKSGLCVSGLSIPAAAKLIELTPSFKSTRLIINIGSVDILHGHALADMCTNFQRLIKVCESRGLEPIITTLAPLENISHSSDMLEKLRQFNAFIMDTYFADYEIIDIWSKMTNSRGNINLKLYNP